MHLLPKQAEAGDGAAVGEVSAVILRVQLGAARAPRQALDERVEVLTLARGHVAGETALERAIGDEGFRLNLSRGRLRFGPHARGRVRLDGRERRRVRGVRGDVGSRRLRLLPRVRGRVGAVLCVRGLMNLRGRDDGDARLSVAQDIQLLRDDLKLLRQELLQPRAGGGASLRLREPRRRPLLKTRRDGRGRGRRVIRRRCRCMCGRRALLRRGLFARPCDGRGLRLRLRLRERRFGRRLRRRLGRGELAAGQLLKDVEREIVDGRIFVEHQAERDRHVELAAYGLTDLQQAERVRAEFEERRVDVYLRGVHAYRLPPKFLQHPDHSLHGILPQGRVHFRHGTLLCLFTCN